MTDSSTETAPPPHDTTEAPPTVEPVFLNRELSWLAFNERVLEEALDQRNPLLERFRFLSIFHTNLDEFFMIRVSGLKQQIDAGVDVLSPDGMSPGSQLSLIHDRVAELVHSAQRCLQADLLPAFAHLGIRLVHYLDLDPDEQAQWDAWYRRYIHPILTPLAVGPTHPFPFISNLSLNLAVLVRSPEGERRLARVKLPLVNVPRLIPLRADLSLRTPVRLLPIEELIAANLGTLFPGMRIWEPYVFRVTRDADLEIKEDEADDLLDAMEQELRRRRFGQAVRLEVQAGMPSELIAMLLEGLSLTDADVQEVEGLMGVDRLASLLKLDLPEHKYPPFVPRTVHWGEEGRARAASDIFGTLRKKDILLHHPFDSFAPVVEFIRTAANDPAVVAIKQTLYRTSGDSPVIRALEEAIENGKQVAAVVELKARFDEENNIVWARRLEEAGVHVIYGVPGLKTHAKLCMVVRREGDELVRYCHVGTGNYNETTARVYTDLGLLTSNPVICSDVAQVFNSLTGFARPLGYRKLMVAPHHMKGLLVEHIRFEAQEAREGRPAGIIAKCNAVVDREVIRELYAASQAGVEIDLLVRGICCLVPGVEGLSENIEVRSVVGRFLEHSRLYWFHHAGDPKAYLGSADLMDRNLARRLEVLCPVEQPELARWLREEFLERYLHDQGRTRRMTRLGSYDRIVPSGNDPDVQLQFLDDLSNARG